MRRLLHKQVLVFLLCIITYTAAQAQLRDHAAEIKMRKHVFPGRNMTNTRTENSPLFKHTLNSLCIKKQKTYGGSGDEYFAYVLKLNDGNFLLYGNTDSGDGDLDKNRGDDDAYLIKINPEGKIIWSKTYGGSGDDGFNQVVENENGDLIAAGYSSSTDGDVYGNHGGTDGWLVKVDRNGRLRSQRCYGGTADDDFDGIVKAKNGDVVIAGTVSSTDGNETGINYHGGDADGWVVRINRAGDLVWQKAIGGSDFEQLNSIVSINNKFYVSGLTYSFDADAIQNHSAPGHFDQFLARFEADGKLGWTACHGGSDDDYSTLQSLVATNDGNLINVGTTGSDDGDVSGLVNTFDAWVPTISAKNGSLISQRCYGSKDREQGLYAAWADDKGGFLLVGADASDFFVDDSWNALVIKVDSRGNEIWKKTFGGSDHDEIDGLVPIDEHNYLLACYTHSTDGDVTNQHGEGDIWMVKMGDCKEDEKITAIANKNADITGLPGKTALVGYPNPFSNFTTISFDLPSAQNVLIGIFDLSGRLTKSLGNGFMEAGKHQITWNARDESESMVPSGIYIVKLRTDISYQALKVVVVK